MASVIPPPTCARPSHREVLDKLLQRVHREVALHDELAVLGVPGADDWLVAADEAAAELLQLLLEVVVLRHGKRDALAGEALGDLHDAVTPVVGACGRNTTVRGQ